MVEVTQRSANWRLFGGGGLLVGGLLALIGVILPLVGVAGSTGPLVAAIGILVIGVALFFVAFGQTGSNGAVGASTAGKAALAIAGAAAVIWAALTIFASFGITAPPVIGTILLVVLVLALLASAAVIFGRGVAQGIAKWALFVPAVVGILLVIDGFADIDGASGWVAIVFAAVTLLTGLAYLFNKVDVKTS